MVQIDPAKDLASLFSSPQQERYSGMRYGQGVITEWNPATFENEVSFRGLTLTNLPILGKIDGLSLKAGDVVGLMGWAPNGGFGSWWILGELGTPPLDEPVAVEGGANFVVRDGGSIIVRDSGDVVVDGGQITLQGGNDIDVNGGDINVNSGGDINVNSGGEIVADDSGNDRRAEMRPGVLAVSNSSGGNEGEIRHNSADDGMYVSSPGGLFCESRGSFATLRGDPSGGAAVSCQGPGQVNIFSGNDTVTVDHVTTGTSANCNITITGRLRRSTSARRYKQDIAELLIDPAAVRRLHPRTWRDRNDVAEHPDSDRWHVGLVAEEVADAGLAMFVEHDERGEPDSVAYDRLSVALLSVVQDQQSQIDELTAWAREQGFTPSQRQHEMTQIPKRREAPSERPADDQPGRQERGALSGETDSP